MWWRVKGGLTTNRGDGVEEEDGLEGAMGVMLRKSPSKQKATHGQDLAPFSDPVPLLSVLENISEISEQTQEKDQMWRKHHPRMMVKVI